MIIFITISIVGVFNSNNFFGRALLVISFILLIFGLFTGLADSSYAIENAIIKINIFEDSYRIYTPKKIYIGRIKCNQMNKKQCLNYIKENKLQKYIL